MSQSCNPRDKLAVAVESFSNGVKALREVIRMRDDEIGRLDDFEKKFNETDILFKQFKVLANEHDKMNEDLEVSLQQEVERQKRSTDSLRNQIAGLKKEVGNLTRENDRLERELNMDVEKLHKQNCGNDNSAYVNDFPIIASPNSFIERLVREGSE